MQERGRLAISSVAPYTGIDGSCNYGNKANGLKSAKIQSILKITNGEAGIIRVLNSRTVAVGFEVTPAFQMYSKGIFKDETCVGDINHAVVAVGYTPEAIICKNSWGQSWGNNGYIYFARFHHGCQIYDFPHYIKLQNTGEVDIDPEYKPTDDSDDCVDFNADGCRCGLIRCSDGTCRHVHMC